MTPATPPNLPASHPPFGGCRIREAERFLLRDAAGLPQSICSPGGLLGRDKGRPPQACERPGCSAVCCREALISFPRGFR